MSIGKALIVDFDSGRLAGTVDRFRAHGFDVIQALTEEEAVGEAERNKPDVLLLRVGAGLDLFHRLAAPCERLGILIIAFLERGFSPAFRKEVLGLSAHGFINDETLPDEWMATTASCVRQKKLIDVLQRAGSRQNGGPTQGAAPLRDRLPELYRDILHRYEQGVKQVLHHRIYKINDDAFEPFRQIAKDLFHANATARDAVQLHYQTLRKIAPTPDAPGAQGYLEVGRTTIIGLMGDLLTYYRDARKNGASANSVVNGSTEHSPKHF